MKELSWREKILLGLVFYLILLFFIYWFVYLPARLDAAELNREMESLEKEYEKLEMEMSGLGYNLTEGEELEAALEQNRNILPEAPHLISLVEFIVLAAQQNQVQLNDLKYTDKSNAPKREQAVALQLDLTLEGRYDRLLDFICSLENATRIISINRTVCYRRSPRIQPTDTGPKVGLIDEFNNIAAESISEIDSYAKKQSPLNKEDEEGTVSDEFGDTQEEYTLFVQISSYYFDINPKVNEN